MSFNQGTSLYSSSLIPQNFSLEHYKWLFSDSSDYLLWYKNSLIVSVANAIGSVVLTSLIAYAFSRYKFVGRKNGLYIFCYCKCFPL